jgi:hypothetical protein
MTVLEQQTMQNEVNHIEGQLRTATAWRRAQLLARRRELVDTLRAVEPTDAPLSAEDLAGVEGWAEVRERACELAGPDERGQCPPEPRDWMRAAGDVLGYDDLLWSADIRQALLERGCELTCHACKGEGGYCECGRPHCLCPKCNACGGTGTEVRS